MVSFVEIELCGVFPLSRRMPHHSGCQGGLEPPMANRGENTYLDEAINQPCAPSLGPFGGSSVYESAVMLFSSS